MKLSSLKLLLLHAFFPNRCPFCERIIEYDKPACQECLDTLPWTDLSKCLICDSYECYCSGYYFEKLLTPLYYKDDAQKAILNFKFHNCRDNARKLAVFMDEALQTYYGDFDYIIPVPFYEDKRHYDGYRHCEHLATELSRLSSIPVLFNVLKKIKKTKKQHQLDGEARLKNLVDAFAVYDAEKIINKKILLIDDIFTTGATANETAKTLIEAGADSVVCLTAAKTFFN